MYIHENLRYHFPTCYAYSVKKPIGELNPHILVVQCKIDDFNLFYLLGTEKRKRSKGVAHK